MQLINEELKELLKHLKYGRDIDNASFEPIYYLIFNPNRILQMKSQLPAIIARLNNNGWEVHVFSIASNILTILQNAPLRNLWLKAEKSDPLQWEKTNQSLSNEISKGALEEKIINKLNEIEGEKNVLLLFTDLEALHPYMRIGSIESKLQGKFSVPTVFLYPGERTGKTNLRFLGFYPEDGNYRSVHIGG
ncbi:BREX protein BrxB domain-containing protein [Thalassobacillus devorans]|uniref:BREX protein BrxB domain-containing protein n=1 Tax=Thalassobacillus devorans TaxID=279813 RepID=UPI00048C8B18|nr:BREX protein BrxB domain-containing protein [Thalassobacillus devorans]